MFDKLMFTGYITDGEIPTRPRGIKTYEAMAAHKEMLETDQSKRWSNRSLAEIRKSSWLDLVKGFKNDTESE